MSVKKIKSGSYQVTVCFGGGTLRKSSRHWTYQDAREYERRLISENKDVALGRKHEYTIAEALERWLEEIVPTLRSARDTRYHAKALLPFIRGKKLSDAGKVWADIKVGLAGHANATINHKGRILRRLCNLAANDWEWIDSTRKIHLLPEIPKERFLTTREVEALAKACTNRKVGDYIRLAAYTGIRKGHLMRLSSEDVKDGWIVLDRSSKTRTLQRVPLHPKVAKIAQRLPLGVSRFQLETVWRDAQKKTGIKARWHDLRHTCASWLAASGADMLTIRDMLGHSTINVTQRYAHLAPKHLESAVRKMQ